MSVMRIRTPAVSLTLSLGVASLSATLVTAQTSVPAGTVERVTVHGKSLEGNLAGDSPDRSVSIYLPPGYATATGRRYPVIYLLHGFTDSDDRWYGRVQHFINVPQVVDRALAAGAKDAIVVMPNALTKFGGSMYSSSVTTGDWEIYVARELVSYVDTHYRTIASVGGRGLAGHSMGGYGTVRIGMKRPDAFAALYAMSSCCLLIDPARGGDVRKILDSDPNVNVRLAALDALRPMATRPDARPRLVAAVATQESPLVQLSLIDLLLESDGALAQSTRHDLAQLLDNPELDPVVRGYLRDRLGRSV